MSDRLLFKELSLHIDVSVWYELERRKLTEWKLDEPRVPFHASVAHPLHLVGDDAALTANVATLDGEFFSGPPASQQVLPLPVDVLNYNTSQALRDMDKKAALDAAKDALLSAVAAAEDRDAPLFAEGRPVLSGVLRTYADLKAHTFEYCAAFPVVDFGGPVTVARHGHHDVEAALFPQGPWWDACSAAAGRELRPLVVDLATGRADALTAATLDRVRKQEAAVAMWDPSPSPHYPCWAWRNVLALMRALCPALTAVRLLCLRRDEASSVVFDCRCDAVTGGDSAEVGLRQAKATGWCSKKFHTVDLSAMMDPVRLAQSSAQLNLSLMKWRMMPQLDLAAVQAKSVLLLGSGTLGCNIARNLMMWGVNKITLVDRGNVSFSNPVRQTLFQLSDCVAEGEARHKAVAAAAAMKRILPTVEAEGVNLTIRMPGHRVDPAQRAAATADIERLDELIRAHDVVFLLTDSRESRWLPTVLAAAHDKPVLNAALGFDSYVVMRHGVAAQAERRVGCYFCADVVAPTDSLTVRTLDQQCTVTRPGGSAVASALAVELLATLCNHEQFFGAPAYVPSEEYEAHAESGTVLGQLPHQVRGSLRDFSSMVLHGPAYAKCTACSEAIVGAYKARGAEFIIECLNDPSTMEEITGLKAEKEAMALAHADWDDESFGSDDE